VAAIRQGHVAERGSKEACHDDVRHSKHYPQAPIPRISGGWTGWDACVVG